MLGHPRDALALLLGGLGHTGSQGVTFWVKLPKLQRSIAARSTLPRPETNSAQGDAEE